MATETECILIVEDNQEVRENLAEILELYGYRIRIASNGLDGAKAAIEHLPDLILCDVMMPELDGFGVLNLLSENERTAAIPFVFITAKTDSEDIRRGMNLGADDYITKPFYKDELLQVVRTRLKKARTRVRVLEGNAPAGVHLSDPERGHARLEEYFASEGERREFEQGTMLVREGEYPHFIYRITQGHVHLSRTHEYGRNYIIAEVGNGEMFGISSALERSPFHYTARAASQQVVALCLPIAKLLHLLNSDRFVAEALMHTLARRVVNYSERLVNQAYDSVRRRTALVLCDLHQQYAEGKIDLSREELAQMVGTTKESVTRALSEFKRDNMVEISGREVRVTKPDALYTLLV
ncbi:DNA-binding response OmpR family regulator [Lewinella aquimaris]|uniref:DNA-binding response OmpR family regulator n=1 Tax=Neolewinella aquimaris TaxID=1835722 RepID=A0A840EDT4_9BACT|nr:response regulator [Neolewinella aquimaris]MBB4079096.1 DNA-binding response OmpR family regulator [Neolewinella aquimaris]